MSTSISALPAATSVTTADTVVVVQSGTTKKATIALLPTGSGSSSGSPSTVYVDAVPAGSGLTNVTADGVADDAAKIQAALTYVGSTLGGGTVVLPPKTMKIASGLTVPAGVKLRGHGSTKSKLQYTATTGIAITVNDGSATPLEGFYVNGPGSGNSSQSNAGSCVGLSISGARLNFRDIEIRRFYKGIDVCHNDTYILGFDSCRIGDNNYSIWADIDNKSGTGSAISNSGERLVFTNCLIDNSVNVGYFSANGASVFFIGCSIDYCRLFGNYWDSNVFFDGCHLETANGATVTSYLMYPSGNAKLSFAACTFIIGGTGVTRLTNPGQGPFNYDNGHVRFTTTDVFYTNPAAAGKVIGNKMHYQVTSGSTTFSSYHFLLSQWTIARAYFVQMDSFAQPVGVTAAITAVTQATGAFTVTFSGALAADAMLVLEVG